MSSDDDEPCDICAAPQPGIPFCPKHSKEFAVCCDWQGVVWWLTARDTMTTNQRGAKHMLPSEAESVVRAKTEHEQWSKLGANWRAVEVKL